MSLSHVLFCHTFDYVQSRNLGLHCVEKFPVARNLNDRTEFLKLMALIPILFLGGGLRSPPHCAMVYGMELNVKYRGLVATTEKVALIKKLIEETPNISRWALSKKLCQEWNWRQANGQLRDMVCRSFLLRVEEAGYIKLPPRKVPSPFVRKKPPLIDIDQTPINALLSNIKPLNIRQVRRTPEEKLCQPVGEHLKYVIFSNQRPIACVAFSSAPRHIGCRDKFIGWTAPIRKKNIHLIAYNTRFLILDWVHVPYLASHLLSCMAQLLPKDWQRIYNHPLYFLETFVDTERFKGTCYKAGNWLHLGETTGLGKNNHTKKPNRSIKAVWGYPLCKDFRKLLQKA
jgi:hypothetical protein